MSFFEAGFYGAVIILTASFIRKSTNRLDDFTIATLFVSYPIIFMVSIGGLATFQRATHQPTVDPYLYAIDRSLGLDPFTLFQMVRETPWLRNVLLTVYDSLLMVVALAWACERSYTLLRAAVIGLAGALVCYYLVPGVGPAHAFTWTSPHTLLPYSQYADMPRNAFPSMHMGLALLIAFNTRNRYLKCFAWLFVGLTGAATIGVGEHYFTDLIASVPYCLAVQYVAERVRMPKAFATPSPIINA